jgi:glyoxylase-like metal-dependent hydrolase (beta-lactamase superfamily II)
MNGLAVIPTGDWYETVDHGDGVSLIHEPWIKPFYRCNMWHVRGRERDMLVDTGLGAVSLAGALPWLNQRPLVTVLSHTHFDHIGSAHEFAERLVHTAESAILAAPDNVATLADPYATDAMFDAFPPGWDAGRYGIPAAPATGLIGDGDVIDLGDRRFNVIHTPGHSPGGIALFEEATGIMIAGDIIYDGPLVTDCYHSDISDYLETMRRLREIPVSIVHGGHFASFGPERYRAIIDGFLSEFGS